MSLLAAVLEHTSNTTSKFAVEKERFEAIIEFLMAQIFAEDIRAKVNWCDIYARVSQPSLRNSGGQVLPMVVQQNRKSLNCIPEFRLGVRVCSGSLGALGKLLA